MTQNIKIVTISVVATLLTLFVINHLILLFILSWFAAGYWGTSILKRGIHWPFTKFEPINIIPMIIGYFFLLISIICEFGTFMEDIKWFFGKILGGKQIKFQSPVVIVKPETK